MIEFHKRNPSPTLGKTWKVSVHGRKNMSLGQIGRKTSESTKIKIRNKLKGRKRPVFSKIWKKNISLSKGGTGVSYENSEYYPKFFSIRNIIRKRDNCICQYCKISEKTHLTLFKKKLAVHHIDYNKKNNNPQNLITLCNNCNIKANANRKYWTKYFTSIVDKYNPRKFG